MKKFRSVALLVFFVSVPLVASAGSSKQHSESEAIENAYVEPIALDIFANQALFITNERPAPSGQESQSDAFAAGCVWVFWYGRWWCVPG